MVSFASLAQLAETLSQTASRLAKRAAIAEAITAAHAGGDAGRFCMYLAGQPFAEHDARKLNAGGALLSRAVKTVAGATDAQLTAAYRIHGDLGAAAHDLFAASTTHAIPQPSLTLAEIATAFDGMATAKTTAIRAALVEQLLARATPLEAKYLLKLMLADMRTGAQQSLVEEAIAVAAGAEVVAVRHAVMLEADLAHAVARAFAGTLAEARMTLFHPLGFMLASPVETPEEAVARFTPAPPKPPRPVKKPRRKKGSPEDLLALSTADVAYAADIATEAAAPEPEGGPSVRGFIADGWGTSGVLAFLEDKYDGMRAQLHCGDAAAPGRVALYSRNREDVTASFPELAEAFAHARSPLILDGEILGWDPATGRALPFAIMGQRIGRKRVDDALRRQIPVVFMAFDVLYAAGELLLPLPLNERRAKLEAIAAELAPHTFAGFTAAPEPAAQHALFTHEATPDNDTLQRLRLSPSTPVEDAAQIDRAYADARARANEGVMLKAAASPYLPGRRGLLWAKLKRELATLDVVITGAEYGSGKRAQLLSDYTFAVRDDDGTLLNVGKAYSGVTDAEILELTGWLRAHTLEDHGHFRTVEPQIVLEVAFNNIMRSDRHASGFALRFPRIITIRRDKPVTEIDTLARVEEVYQSQPDKADRSGSA